MKKPKPPKIRVPVAPPGKPHGKRGLDPYDDTEEQLEESEPMAIKGFFGQYRFLSNFFESWTVYEIHGTSLSLPTLEHAYALSKAHSVDAFLKQLSLTVEDVQDMSPGQMKTCGRLVDLRKSWEADKVPVMRKLLRSKFAPDTVLAERLVATGDAHLEEANPWGDRFWGTTDGEGLNMLGILLMEIRDELNH